MQGAIKREGGMGVGDGGREAGREAGREKGENMNRLRGYRPEGGRVCVWVAYRCRVVANRTTWGGTLDAGGSPARYAHACSRQWGKRQGPMENWGAQESSPLKSLHTPTRPRWWTP